MARLEPDMQPTLIGCPDYSGVLSVRKEGPEGHLRYVCHVGHSFSIYSLLEAKENQLEEGLWSAVSLLGHVGMISAELKKHAGSTELRRQLEARCKQIQAHEKILRDVIAQSEPPALESEGEEGNSPRRG